MKYIELIVALNILIHINFIKLSNFIMNRKNNWILISISSLIDGLYVTCYLLIPQKVDSFRYLIILILSILPFVNRRTTVTLFSCIIYLMFNFILGGFTGIIINIINYYFIVLVGLIFINLIFCLYAVFRRNNVNNKSLIYKIIINENDKDYLLLGFCDTGNFLKTDNNIPIVFVNRKYKFGRYYKTILIQTVGQKYEIGIYKLNSFKICVNNKYIKKDVYISYSDISYDCLFGCDLIGG